MSDWLSVCLGVRMTSEGGKKVRGALEKSIKTIEDTLVPLFDASKLRNPFEDGTAEEKTPALSKDREEAPLSVLDDAKKNLNANSSRVEKMSAACELIFLSL